MPAVSGKLLAGQIRAHILELAIYYAADSVCTRNCIWSNMWWRHVNFLLCSSDNRCWFQQRELQSVSFNERNKIEFGKACIRDSKNSSGYFTWQTQKTDEVSRSRNDTAIFLWLGRLNYVCLGWRLNIVDKMNSKTKQKFSMLLQQWKHVVFF